MEAMPAIPQRWKNQANENLRKTKDSAKNQKICSGKQLIWINSIMRPNEKHIKTNRTNEQVAKTCEESKKKQ